MRNDYLKDRYILVLESLTDSKDRSRSKVTFSDFAEVIEVFFNQFALTKKDIMLNHRDLRAKDAYQELANIALEVKAN